MSSAPKVVSKIFPHPGSSLQNSSTPIANSRKPNPRPPYSFLIKRPIKPNSQAFFQRSLGNSSLRSYSRATSGNSPSANSRAAKRICFCRLVSSKSIFFSLNLYHQAVDDGLFVGSSKKFVKKKVEDQESMNYSNRGCVVAEAEDDCQ